MPAIVVAILVFAALLGLPANSAHAATVVIPDPRLEALVREALATPSGDITDTDMLGLTNLTAYGDGIADLTGLEYATNLTWLEIVDNEITTITPLAGLTDLQTLDLSGNQIADITPVAGLTSLTWLKLADNQVSGITAVAGLTNLTELYLDGNQITTITPVAGLSNLTNLNLSGNPIKTTTFTEGLTNLTALHLNGCQITTVTPVADLTNLTWLELGDNHIIDITPVAGLTNLTGLDLGGNQIADITPVGGLTNLTWLLDLSGNQVTDVALLEGLTKLRTVQLDNNQISVITSMTALTDLANLGLTYNRLDVRADSPAMVAIAALELRDVTVTYLPQSIHLITPSAGAHGTISPSALQTVNHGSDAAFTIAADPGYHIVDVTKDGVSIGASSSVTFGNVTENHTIAASFAESPVTRRTYTSLAGPASVKVRRALKLKGTVAPTAAAGRVKITMKRLVGKKWRSAGSIKVAVKQGKYSYGFKPKYRGRWRIVATYLGGKVGVTTYKSSASRTKNVRVR
jgi:hypothetical protein